MKIMITGGAGFLGSHLADRLLQEAENQVIVYDNLIRGRIQHMFHQYPNSNYTYVEGDIRDLPHLMKTSRGVELLYHLADLRPLPGAEPDLDYQFTTQVNGTYNVLQAARENEIGRMVFGSALDVYAAPYAGPVDEEHALGSNEVYGAGKIAGEMYCQVFQQKFGLNIEVLRLGDAYGPRLKDDLVSRWVNLARQGKDIVLEQDGVLDLAPLRVMIDGLLAAGKLAGQMPVNLGSGQATRLSELAGKIANLCGGRSKIQVRRAGLKTGPVADVRRMQETLGVQPPADPGEGLPELITPRPSLGPGIQ